MSCFCIRKRIQWFLWDTSATKLETLMNMNPGYPWWLTQIHCLGILYRRHKLSLSQTMNTRFTSNVNASDRQVRNKQLWILCASETARDRAAQRLQEKAIRQKMQDLQPNYIQQLISDQWINLYTSTIRDCASQWYNSNKQVEHNQSYQTTHAYRGRTDAWSQECKKYA